MMLKLLGFVSAAIPCLFVLLWEIPANPQESRPAPQPVYKFSSGGGFGGCSLTLFADSTCVKECDDDLPNDPPWFFDGTWSLEGDSATIQLASRSNPTKKETIIGHFIPWGRTLFFIEREEMLHFCEEFNEAIPKDWWNPNYFYHTEFDSADDHYAKPQVPPYWTKFLFAYPIKAAITSIDTGVFSISIDKGSSSGIYNGCPLFLASPYQEMSYRATHIENNSAVLQDTFFRDSVLFELQRLSSTSNLNTSDSIKLREFREMKDTLNARYSRIRVGNHFSTARTIKVRESKR